MIYKLVLDAFASTPEAQAAFEQARENRAFAKSRFGLHPGGLEGAVAYYRENPTPQVIVVEETGDDQAMLERLNALAEVCEPGTKVIVVGSVNDIAVYRHLLAQGVSDYLVMPVAPRELVEAVSGLFADPSASPRGRVLAFYGARGGVGSSTIAHNVAWNLARQIEDDVVLVDLDLAYGTAALALNLDARQTVADALAQPERLDTVLLERFLVKHEEHLLVLGAPGNLRAGASVDAEALDLLLDLARQMAPWVVLDLPHRWSPWVSDVLAMADELVVVALPDLANLRDCKNLIETVGARRGDGAALRIVLNRVDAYKKSQLSAKDFQENLNVAPLAGLPFEPALFGEAANNGQMIGEAAKGHKVTEMLRQIAVQVSGRQPAGRRGKHQGLLAWLKKGR